MSKHSHPEQIDVYGMPTETAAKPVTGAPEQVDVYGMPTETAAKPVTGARKKPLESDRLEKEIERSERMAYHVKDTIDLALQANTAAREIESIGGDGSRFRKEEERFLELAREEMEQEGRRYDNEQYVKSLSNEVLEEEYQRQLVDFAMTVNTLSAVRNAKDASVNEEKRKVKMHELRKKILLIQNRGKLLSQAARVSNTSPGHEFPFEKVDEQLLV